MTIRDPITTYTVISWRYSLQYGGKLLTEEVQIPTSSELHILCKNKLVVLTTEYSYLDFIQTGETVIMRGLLWHERLIVYGNLRGSHPVHLTTTIH